MTVARFLKMAVLLVLLTGCSRVQLVYGQLDWLIPYYAETYMEFTEDQRVVLDRRVDELLRWHCATQIGAYADVLRSANTDFQAGVMTTERIGEYTARGQRFWREIMRRVGPDVAELLAMASDEQIHELFSVFKDKNETWLADFEEKTEAELREDYVERITDELERWFGPLRPTQQHAVIEWSKRFKPLGLEGLRMRKRWQARLRDLTENRKDEETFHAGIHALFLNPKTPGSPAIQKRFDDNMDLAIDLVREIGARMNAEQRNHLADQTASVAADLDELVCAPEPPDAAEQNTAEQNTAEQNGERPDPPSERDVRSDP